MAKVTTIITTHSRHTFTRKPNLADVKVAGHDMLRLVNRRILLSIFALSIALISSITFLALRNPFVLAGGLAVAIVMFVIVLFLPTHLLENPMRHARGLRPPDQAGRDQPSRP